MRCDKKVYAGEMMCARTHQGGDGPMQVCHHTCFFNSSPRTGLNATWHALFTPTAIVDAGHALTTALGWQVYHRTCFRCAHCNRGPLRPDDWSIDVATGDLLCTTHFIARQHVASAVSAEAAAATAAAAAAAREAGAALKAAAAGRPRHINLDTLRTAISTAREAGVGGAHIEAAERVAKAAGEMQAMAVSIATSKEATATAVTQRAGEGSVVEEENRPLWSVPMLDGFAVDAAEAAPAAGSVELV